MDCEGQYRCIGSGEIIPSDWICDGMDDCELGDDEVDCDEGWTTEPTPEPTTEYTTGWATPSWATPSWKCVTDWMWSTSFGDGRTTQPTPSPTSGGGYRCSGSDETIPLRWLCDGMDDCEFGDDEVDCE